MRLINADALKEIIEYQQMIEPKLSVYDVIKLIDNAPTVECENCDYRKFTETFINGVVEVMNKNGISSVEQLSEILKGAEK